MTPAGEPFVASDRPNNMMSISGLRRSIVACATVGSIALAGCGSDGTDASGDNDAPPTSEPVGTIDSAVPTTPDAAGEVIGTGNVGGPVVDPQPHPIDVIDIAESYPEQLIVRFTSGDPNCTAADATATADGDTIVVSLEVGITEDALSRSCLAGDVEQSVTIALDEGLDGRDVIAG